MNTNPLKYYLNITFWAARWSACVVLWAILWAARVALWGVWMGLILACLIGASAMILVLLQSVMFQYVIEHMLNPILTFFTNGGM